MMTDLNEKIKNLPNEIKNKIVINSDPNLGLQRSNFINYINNDKIKELDDELNSGCIKNKSLYELSEKKLVNGLKVCILNDTNIYRTYLAFLNKEVQDEFVKKDLTRPIYSSNKYYGYALARTIWGGIHSFKITKKVTLIDMFDKDNINKILELADKYITNNNENIIFKKMLKITSLLNFEDSIVNYNHFNKHKKKSHINIYTPTSEDISTYHYCKNETSDINFVPMVDIKYLNNQKVDYTRDVVYMFFKYILPHLKNINGITYKQIPSILFKYGRYYCEEIVIDGNTFLNNLELDRNDPICWMNYNLKQNYRNIHMYFNIGEFFNLLYHYEKSKNEEFALFNYYKNNKLKTYTKINKDKKYILSYNLHRFENISFDIKLSENVINILKFIRHYKNNIDILFFQEFGLDKILLDQFNNIIHSFGYIYMYTCSNGGSKLVCYTKIKCQTTIIDTTYSLTKHDNELLENIYIYTGNNIRDFKMSRNQIILHYNDIHICGVHLSIGVPLLIIKNENITKLNNNIRIAQLKKIISNKPDMIIGDFNFTINDNEHEFLSKYYHNINNDNDKSTPYNRVDHVYYHKNKKLDNKLLICNYSDHLPLIQEIPLI